MKKVLGVCAGNTARSVMMAAGLQRELGDEFQVESAGTDEDADGHSADDYAIQCMEKRGIDVSTHRSRWVGNIDLSQFSHIVCVNWKVSKEVEKFLGDDYKPIIWIPVECGIPLLPGGGLAEYEKYAMLLDKVVPEVAKMIRG